MVLSPCTSKLVLFILIVGPLVWAQFWAIASIIFWSVKKLNFLPKILKRVGFVSVIFPWKQIPRLKIWGLEQTSQMGQQNGWEKRHKEHFFKGGILTNKITLFFWPFFVLSGPFLGRKQVFGMDLGLALTRGIQLELI